MLRVTPVRCSLCSMLPHTSSMHTLLTLVCQHFLSLVTTLTGRFPLVCRAPPPQKNHTQALAARDPSALQSVLLVVERQGYGRLEWLQPVDIEGLDLQDIVQIERGMGK